MDPLPTAHCINTFQYSPLALNEIRLVKIVPGTDEDPLECELFHTKLRKLRNGRPAAGHQHYAALSYTWGDASLQCAVIINRQVWHIRQNLANALNHFRQLPGDHIMWIDALCINQADLEEKTQQLRRMTTIYARADQIVGWLGMPEDNSSLAIDKIHHLDAIMTERLPTHNHDMFSVTASLSEEDIFGPLTLEESPQTREVDTWLALHKFFRRSWWFRSWVLQEASSPAHFTLVCGSRELSWHAISVASFMLLDIINREALSDLAQSGPAGPNRLIMFIHLRNSRSPIPRRLLNLLSKTRKSVATDPRDKIFTMLPFASDVSPDKITTDYRKPISQLYAEVAIWHIEKHNNLDILGACSHSTHLGAQDNNSEDLKLPSWIPDWRDTSEQQPFQKDIPSSTTDSEYSHGSRRCYDADGSSRATRTSYIPPQLREDPQSCFKINGSPKAPQSLSLTVKVLRLTTISLVHPVCVEPQATAIERSWCPYPFEHVPAAQATPARDPLTNEPVLDVYLRTLVADIHFLGNGIHVRDGKMSFPEFRGLEPHSGDTRRQEFNSLIAMKEHTMYRRMFHTANVAHSRPDPMAPRGALYAGGKETGGGSAMFGHGGGLIGLGPCDARLDDEIFVIRGGSMLYVLRPVGGDAGEVRRFTLVGECYVHGLMDGEALDMLERKNKGGTDRVLEDMDDEFREILLV